MFLEKLYFTSNFTKNSNKYSSKSNTKLLIYLKFYILKYQTQKKFYLEAYDATTRETIITNGDCHFINIIKNNKYEIRIDRELNPNNFV